MQSVNIQSATLFLIALGINTMLAYVWSFTQEDFGGVLGVLLPPALTAVAYIAGRMHRGVSAPW